MKVNNNKGKKESHSQFRSQDKRTDLNQTELGKIILFAIFLINVVSMAGKILPCRKHQYKI